MNTGRYIGRYVTVGPVSPRSADPALRAALVDAAARILAADGPRALTTRRLAAEADTSTMAVYTHFGGIDEVRRAVRQQGFARLTGALNAVARTDDPVADLTSAGLAYFANGLAHPELYRAMFVDQPPHRDGDAGEPTFQRLVTTVARCADARRFDPVEPAMLLAWAAELWTMQHGMVTLALTRLLPVDQIRFLLTDMTYRLCVGFGDKPTNARRSIERASRTAPSA